MRLGSSKVLTCGNKKQFLYMNFFLTVMQLDGQFVSGIAMTFFGLLLVLFGVLIDMFNIFFPVALVFIFAGIALKIISVKNLG